MNQPLHDEMDFRAFVGDVKPLPQKIGQIRPLRVSDLLKHSWQDANVPKRKLMSGIIFCPMTLST